MPANLENSAVATGLEKVSFHSNSKERQCKRMLKRLHTYTETKHHPRANKFQSKTYHANSLATQEHSPELQYTGCPKSLQTHWHLITHYWTLNCTPKRRNPTPPTRILTQASPWQVTRTTPPTVRKFHNKKNSTNCQNTERPPKHSNINKMKRQRNTQQVKEQDKCPPNQKNRKR